MPDQYPKDLPTGCMISVVLPCLNEEPVLGACLKKIKNTLSQMSVAFEIVVCDNGSVDHSVAIAEGMGAKVVHEPNRGYGRAYLKGFSAAQGQYLIMGDADDTYDFRLIPDILKHLQNGYDFVTGSRYEGTGTEHLPFLSRVVGNPALTSMVNIVFGSHYSDVYCGLRGFSRTAFDKIHP